MRLRTLPLALSSVITAVAIARETTELNIVVVVLLFATTILLQVLSNFANDYGDFQNGADNEHRIGPARAVQSGLITPIAMKKAVILTSLLALISGILLLWFSLAAKGLFMYALIFLGLGLASIAAAIKYTSGKNPYGYRGLGDLFVFVFFGVVAVGGSAFLLKGTIGLSDVFGMAIIGMLSTAVLNVNNMRDHINDKAAGKKTIVVSLGFEKAKIYHSLLIITAVLIMLALLFTTNAKYAILSLIVVPIFFKHLVFVWKCKAPPMLDTQLKIVALTTFLYSALLLISSFI